MLGAWIQVCDHHLDSLDLLVLGRDRTHLVCDLISFHRHVFPVNAVKETDVALKIRHESISKVLLAHITENAF